MARLGKLVVDLAAETKAFHRDMRRAAEETNRFQHGVTRMGKAVVGAFASFVTVTAAVRGIRYLATEVMNAEQEMAKLHAVVAATGGAAGLTADQVSRLADELERSTLFDGGDIKNAAAALLTFKSIAGETFRRTLELAADTATIFGSLESATLQLGKALEDPVEGLTALRRVGVSFTDQQKALIKSLVEGNRQYEAQRVILDALEGQVGGTARSLAGDPNSLTASINAAQDAWREFVESLGDSQGVVGSALVDLATGFRMILSALTSTTGTEKLQAELADVQDEFIELTATIRNSKRLGEDWLSMLRDVGDSTPEFERLVRTSDALSSRWLVLRKEMNEIAAKLMESARARVADEGAAKAQGRAAQELIELERERALVAEALTESLKQQATVSEQAGKNIGGLMDRNIAAMQQFSREFGERQVEIRKLIEENWSDFLDRVGDANKQLTDSAGVFEAAWEQGIRNVQDSFASLFRDSLMGELRTIEDFADRALHIIADMFAQIAAMRAVTGLFNFLGIDAAVQHAGGMAGSGPRRTVPAALFLGAPRLHDGLRSDEFPAILQRGERVIPRDQAAAAGSGGDTINTAVSVNVQALDPRGVAELLLGSKGVLHGIMIEAMQTNRSVQQAMAAGSRMVAS